jgi:replicative DNA helicase
MEETPLNARTAGSQPAVQMSTGKLSTDWDDSTADPALQVTESDNLAMLPPHNREAEEAVLGSVLINPSVVDELDERLRTSDFYITRNGWIWEAIAQLRTNGLPIDYLTLIDNLRQNNRLEGIGGPAYLMGLVNRTPSSLHAATYGQMVKDTATCRRLVLAGQQIAQEAYRQPYNAARSVEMAEQAVFLVSNQQASHEMVSAKTAMSDLYDQVTDQSNGCGVRSIPSGFIDLDQLLGGFYPSDLAIVGARPSVGKTSFLTGLALHAAREESKHVAVFSLEMSTEQLSYRLASQETGIDSQRLRTGQLSQDEWINFTRATEQLSELPLHMNDTPALTPTQLRSQCRRLCMQGQLDLVIIDYLQLMSTENRFDNRVQEVGYISRQLKLLARELDVPVLAAAQLSRAVEMRADKRPVLSDLRESGNLEMDADIVLFLHRLEEPQEKGITEVIVAKHRQGPTGKIDLIFSEQHAGFKNMAKNDGGTK